MKTKVVLPVWLFLCRLGVWLWFKLHLQKAKTAAYRMWVEAPRERERLGLYPTFEMLSSRLVPSWWAADSWREMWDAVASPEHVEWVWSRGEKPTHGFDCDEFAIWLTAAVNRSIAAGYFKEPVSRAWFFTVMWVNAETLKPYGHNVCLLEFPQQTDGSTWYAYMDYEAPSAKKPSPRDIALQVVEDYEKGARLIGWVKQDIHLTPAHVEWGE